MPLPSSHLHAAKRRLVGDATKILGVGDTAYSPAGVMHRAFANQSERLVLLVVTAPAPRSAPSRPSKPEPVVREEPAPVIVRTAPAEEAVEIPLTRRSFPTLGSSASDAPDHIEASSDFARMLDDLRSLKRTTVAEAPPALPAVERRTPRSSRVRDADDAPVAPAKRTTIEDLLPAAFRKPAPEPPPLAPIESAPEPAPVPRDEEEPSKPSDHLLPEIFRKPAMQTAS